MQYFSAAEAEQIRQLVVNCGQQAKQLSTKDFQVFEKGIDDYVTSVDRTLDLQLADGFSGLFPADGVITEENAHSRQTFGSSCPRLWLIDPIDGTDDFMRRRSHYAVMAGLLHDYQPVAGWVYAPVLHQLYYGGAEWGLFQSRDAEAPEPIAAQAPPLDSEIHPFILSKKDQRRFGQAITRYIPQARFYSLGSFGLKVMEVVLGRAGLYIYLNGRVKLWDTTGPIAIAQAAGLICCDLEGRRIAFDPSAVDSETLVHRQAIIVGWPDYVQRFQPLIQAAVSEAEATD